jgi:hypothetical protein
MELFKINSKVQKPVTISKEVLFSGINDVGHENEEVFNSLD